MIQLSPQTGEDSDIQKKKTSGNTFCGNPIGDYFKAIHQDDINV